METPAAEADQLTGRDLKGLSLSQAYRRFVIDDPGVQALGAQIITRHGYASVFRDAQAPGPLLNFHWPLTTTASDLAKRFVDSGSINGQMNPPALIEEVARVIVNRLYRFKGALIHERARARGTFLATGTVVDIDHQQWARTDMWVDVVNSDLCSGRYAQAKPIWTGVSFLLNARKRSLGKAVAAQLMSPERASVARAVEALWPDGVPAGLSIKIRDRKINKWQSENECAVVNSRTIRRYLATGD